MVASTKWQLQKATGHQLLLLAVFGDGETRQKIDAELDRRARMRAYHRSAFAGMAGGDAFEADDAQAQSPLRLVPASDCSMSSLAG